MKNEHYYCAGEFHRCWDGGGAGEALRYNPSLLPPDRRRHDLRKGAPRAPRLFAPKLGKPIARRRQDLERQRDTLEAMMQGAYRGMLDIDSQLAALGEKNIG